MILNFSKKELKTLTPSFVGSNPATPAKLDSVEHFEKGGD